MKLSDIESLSGLGKISWKKSVSAGIAIGLGCSVNLAVGGIYGAILFSLGLLLVLVFDLSLFTGKVGKANFTGTLTETGKIPIFMDIPRLLKILVGNIFGISLVASIIYFGGFPEILDKANSVSKERESLELISVFFRSVGCGVIMDTLVRVYQKTNKLWPVILGIPTFILSGFLHSVAEPFYLLISGNYGYWLISYYVVVILGNFVGCRVPRFLGISGLKS